MGEIRYTRGPRPVPRRLGRLAVVCVAALMALATGRAGTAAQGPEGFAQPRSAGSAPTAVHAISSGQGSWDRFLASEATCPGGDSMSAPAAAQMKTMTCLVNYARAAKGLRRLRVSPLLSVAARRKAEEIQRCHVFDHAPCGGKFDDVAVRAGYSGSLGENLLLGEGYYGAPRSALAEWLTSAGHRAILFSSHWRVQSAYVAHVAELDDLHDATLWITQFGDR